MSRGSKPLPHGFSVMGEMEDGWIVRTWILRINGFTGFNRRLGLAVKGCGDLRKREDAKKADSSP